MFDTVVYEMPCPLCGAKVSDFQSKDGACFLELLQPHDVRNFYSGCGKCGAWIQCVYTPPRGCGQIDATATIRKWNAETSSYDEPEQQKTVTMDWDPDANKKDNA